MKDITQIQGKTWEDRDRYSCVVGLTDINWKPQKTKKDGHNGNFCSNS
jgi:hypothetical protein